MSIKRLAEDVTAHSDSKENISSQSEKAAPTTSQTCSCYAKRTTNFAPDRLTVTARSINTKRAVRKTDRNGEFERQSLSSHG
jgi:hypothetical protein